MIPADYSRLPVRLRRHMAETLRELAQVDLLRGRTARAEKRLNGALGLEASLQPKLPSTLDLLRRGRHAKIREDARQRDRDMDHAVVLVPGVDVHADASMLEVEYA
jgi:hypothetical protein